MSEQGELIINEVYAYLRLHDTPAAIDFYARAFDAKELFRLVEPSGRVGHAEIKIGPVTLMLSDEYPELGIRGPRSQFYGERSGTVRDPFGHEWLLGGHIEDVTPEEMQRRYDALFSER
jgi:uncharacterized glyoxalase superfamily protein PhnB